jgi:hypothetical protein
MAKRIKLLSLFVSLASLLITELSVAQSFSQTGVQIGSVSRRTGGSIAKIKLSKPSVIQGLILEVSGASLKLYSVNLNLDNGQSVSLEELSKSEQATSGQTLESANLSTKGLVSSIEIRAESMGGDASLNMSAVSDVADLRLALESMVVANPPVQRPAPIPEPPVVQQPPLDLNPPAEEEEPIAPEIPRYRQQRQQQQRPVPPRVITPTPGVSGGQCYQGVCVGQSVYISSGAARLTQVVRIERGGTFQLRFLDTGAVSGGWSRSEVAVTTGCSGSFCVGNSAYRVASDSRLVQIAGLSLDGTYVVRFLDTGAMAGGWSSAELAATRGCSQGVCVGQSVYRVASDSRLTQVVGIQSDGTFVLRFLDNGGWGGGWSRSEVAVTTGCGRTYCVGQTAYNNRRVVQVVGVMADGNYVLRFLDTGGLGGGWSDSDLSRGRGY